ncbi:ABC transporter permease [Actinoalloteichus hymeniacidonis]|uniref:Uncharacterized protein n=1 Tax=Actinoalloteichus hymeniacidonis TaxID=340345 RepID=A0AAC9HMH3_9PSEU|nr:ABC transporter permease [Actinoalloteichus hymeniacidonis]AOS61886.1 hypothetical protein TL08_05295 [Actinoalloteichus hymeniacidonis]MBB5910094.1 fluoroquinolone transport system permease protein [Actinoalloteichus hymeniacidonis]
MARALTVFARNDLRGARRDPLIIGMILAPLVWIATVRFGTPPVTRMLAENTGFDLTSYYPLILVGFLLLTSPIVIGGVTALLLLDERDAGTLTAMRVTPVSPGDYLAYRSITAVGVTLIFVLGTMSASGILPLALLPSLVPIGVLTGQSTLVIALAILQMAKNKVEGLAALRGMGIVIAGLPLLPAFIEAPWSLVFGIVPTYWPAQAFIAASDGTTWWPYLVGGIVYQTLLLWPLYRRFGQSM